MATHSSIVGGYQEALVVKNPPANADVRDPRNPVDRGVWRAKVHEVAKSGTRLSN